MDTLEELLNWLLNDNGVVGILDATNSTRARRKMILERVHQIEDLNVLFIESICTDKKVSECLALAHPCRFWRITCVLNLVGQTTKVTFLPSRSYSTSRHRSPRSPRRLSTTCSELRKGLRTNRRIRGRS